MDSPTQHSTYSNVSINDSDIPNVTTQGKSTRTFPTFSTIERNSTHTDTSGMLISLIGRLVYYFRI